MRSSLSMVIDCSLPVPRSLALTLRMPLVSMSKVTSIWGLLMRLMPLRRNLPMVLLSLARGRSPCKTLISTWVCSGEVVVKIWL